MPITKEDAIRYASEKLDIIPKDFCWIGDLCTHFSHKIDDLQDIQFHGYGIIEGIEWEPNSNPIWKRIDVYIKSFSFFPPIICKPVSMQILHLVQGWYENVDRTRKIYIVPIERLKNILNIPEEKPTKNVKKENSKAKIFEFKQKVKNDNKN